MQTQISRGFISPPTSWEWCQVCCPRRQHRKRCHMVGVAVNADIGEMAPLVGDFTSMCRELELAQGYSF